MRFWGQGPAPAQPIEFAGAEVEPERYSADRAWMPRVVLLAKSTYGWISSRKSITGPSPTWIRFPMKSWTP